MNVNSGDLFVDESTERVGVGTETPGRMLHVDGEVQGNRFFGSDDNENFLDLDDSDDALLSAKRDVIVNADADSDDAGAISLRTKGATRVYVKNDGNVGIGTTGPGSTLHVQNRWGSQGTPMVYLENTHDGDTLYVKHNAQRADMYVANFLNSAGSVLAVKGNGSVGVGTASPDSKFKLDVNGTTAVRGELYCANRVGIGTFNPKFKLELVGDHDLMKLQASSSSAYYEGLVFYNNKNERHAGIRAHTPYSQGSITGDLEIWTETAGADIVLAPVGGVGIGTDSPEHKLDVNGSAVVRGPLYLATPGDYRLQSLVVGDDSPPMLVFDSITNDHRTVLVPAQRGLWISDQYNSRVNVELTDAGNFWVRGTVTAQGGFSGSDARMKTDQKPLEYGMADIMALQPKQYFQASVDKDMVTGEISFDKDSGTNSIGFIAQEVRDVIPEAVHVPEDESKEIWSMDYDKIVTVLVKAMQEQQQEIESLKRRIEVLEGGQ